jgi:hypothetical protein
MKKIVNYVYLGTNGTIMSPVHLEGIYYIRKYRLQADEGKKLTSDGKNFFYETYVNEEDLDQWTEVDE